MLYEIKDYAKCVVQNRFTFTGLLSAGAWLTMKYVEHKTKIPINQHIWGLTKFILSEYGGISLIATVFGAYTFSTYRRTKKHIEKFGTIDGEFKDKLSGEYCGKCAVKLAAKEAGLEYLL